MKGRRRYWPSVLRVTATHWRYHVNDWGQCVVVAGTVIGTRREALEVARTLARKMEERAQARELVNN